MISKTFMSMMSKTLMEELDLGALVWTLLGALALEGLRAPLTVIPAVEQNKPGRGGEGREAKRGGAAAEGSATAAPTDTDELRWGHEHRARRWREAAALQRRQHVARIALEGGDCGYRPYELWTSAAEPHKQRAIVREDVRGRKKHGRVKAADPRRKGCSAATAVDVDVVVDTVKAADPRRKGCSAATAVDVDVDTVVIIN